MSFLIRTFGCAALAALCTGVLGAGNIGAAISDNRTLALYNIHTKETLTVTYKKAGKFVPEAMDQIDWIMRDWRRNEKTRMDPQTIDILWEMHTELGSKEPIHIICGYRSRATNEMLRRTVGGQASESQHITGKAIDVTFPDVPLKQIRYSALIRQQGGVGYYPTSGIPFIHVDTGRVRHWPRLPRYELALLFPNGVTKHAPSDGGAITAEDVRIAKAKHSDLANQIAGFFTLRQEPKTGVMVADAGAAIANQGAAKSQPLASAKPSGGKSSEPKLAALVEAPALAPTPAATPAPKIVAEPKLVERPSRLRPGPSESDRSKLTELAAFVAAEDPPPRLISGPLPAIRRAAGQRSQAPLATLTAAAGGQPILSLPLPDQPRTAWTQVAALEPESLKVLSDAPRAGWGNGWVSAPTFDDEHPEELSYRPFPIAPFLTATASINEPVLSRMVAPDLAKILTLIDTPTAVLPMRFLPGEQTAEVMWAQQFQGKPVQLAEAVDAGGGEVVPTQLIPRRVKTTDGD